MTTIELVRHAKALRREQWQDQPDDERPLSCEGHRQADALADLLPAAGGVDALVSSPSLRCVQTVEPLAKHLGLAIEHATELAEAVGVPVLDRGDPWVSAAWLAGRALGVVDRVLAAHPRGRVVVCSHGDVVPAVLAALSGRDGLDLANVHARKGAWVSLRFDGTCCVAAEPHDAP